MGRVFFARGIISPGQKWWETLLGREISWSQWEGPSIHSRSLAFFHFKSRVGAKGFFFIFPWFPMYPTLFPSSSHHVPNMFSIAPQFYPICFGKCCPPFTYIFGQQRGRTLYFKKELLDFRNLHNFICFEWWANQVGLLPKKSKNWTWEAPHLINRRGLHCGTW
jgi:hypothetical protein